MSIMEKLFLVAGLIIAILVVVTILGAKYPKFGKLMAEAAELERIGVLSPNIVCQQCNVTGQVHTKSVKNKKGISGGKATGALLTGGISLLATGLSRKEKSTQAHCKNCNSTWSF